MTAFSLLALADRSGRVASEPPKAAEPKAAPLAPVLEEAHPPAPDVEVPVPSDELAVRRAQAAHATFWGVDCPLGPVGSYVQTLFTYLLVSPLDLPDLRLPNLPLPFFDWQERGEKQLRQSAISCRDPHSAGGRRAAGRFGHGSPGRAGGDARGYSPGGRTSRG